MKKPNFFIAGASKAGTEWLRISLRKHPNIFIPRGPTPDYFSHRYHKKQEWYLSLFEKARDETAIGEKSSSYIIHPNTPKRIYSFNRKADVFFVLRHPVERAYSHYKMLLRAGKVSEDVDRELSKSSKLVKEGMYYSNISRFLEYFDREQVNIFIYDDLKKNPVRFIQKFYSALGVDEAFVPDTADTKYHVTKARPKFQKIYNLIVFIIRQIKWRSDWANRYLQYLRTEGYLDIFHNLNEGDPFPTMSDKKISELSSFYQDDINKLEKLVERDLSHWYSVG